MTYEVKPNDRACTIYTLSSIPAANPIIRNNVDRNVAVAPLSLLYDRSPIRQRETRGRINIVKRETPGDDKETDRTEQLTFH